MTDSIKANETSSGEVVNGFRSCRDLSDIVPLYTVRGIYLKPIAKIHVSINLPQLKSPGKTISTWEVMEKIRLLVRPDEFASLKVVKSTLEFIRFEGDLGDRSRLQRVLARLEGQRLNLVGFPNVLKVKAVEVKDDFPTRHSWDSYFRDAKHMNELKAGERPDTIHISGLPIKWFSEDDGKTPSEPLIANIFKRWGNLRRVDVPAADPYRTRMRLNATIQKFSYDDGIFFDAFIQYIEYMNFVKAMDALRGMKLFKKDKDKNYLVASLKVDFDKTKHMSDNSVAHREFERKRLITLDNLAAEKLRRKEEAQAKKKEEKKKKEESDLKEKECRRKTREEKRKRKVLTVFRKQEEDKVSMKIAREERKLIRAQRQLESIRLLDLLFDRIKLKVEKNEIEIKPKSVTNDNKSTKPEEKTDDVSKGDANNIKKRNQKEKLKNKKKTKKRKNKKSDGSDSDIEKNKGITGKNINKNSEDSLLPFPNVYPRLPPQAWYYNTPMPLIYPQIRGFPRGRRGGGGGRRGRWHNNPDLQNYNPHEYNEQYYKYFANLVGQDYRGLLGSDFEKSQSRSRSRSRHRSNSRSRSKSRSRRRRSKSSNRRQRSRSRKRNSNSRKKSRSRSKSHSRSKRRQDRRRSNSRLREASHSRSDKRRRGRSLSRAKSKVRVTRAKSRSITPRRRSRSSSWSLPKSPGRRSCSWSKAADEKASEKKTDEENKKAATPHTPPIEANSVKPGKNSI